MIIPKVNYVIDSQIQKSMNQSNTSSTSLQRQPSKPNKQPNTVILLSFLMLSFCLPLRGQFQLGGDIDGEAVGNRNGFSVSMPDAYTLAIGAQRNNGNGSEAGQVRIYTWNGMTWVQKGTDIDGENANDLSGTAVSMPDANTVAIGATEDNGNGGGTGYVRIYSWDGTAWIQKGIDIDGEAAYNDSGTSVSMPDANTIAIGATRNSGFAYNAGHARIYSWNGTAWVQKGIDIDGETFDNSSGWSVSMPDANTIAIGAGGNDENGTDAGHVRIYTWNGTAWVQKGIDIDGEAANDYSGKVSMPDVNTVAIGARGNDGNGSDAGHVRIYLWDGTSWVQKGVDIDGEMAWGLSGDAVSMPDANTVAIGAWQNANGGSVRVYKLKGVYGRTYQDFNQNCIKDNVDIGVSNRILTLNPGNILVNTNSNGSWHLDSLPIGTYTLTADTSSPLWQVTCPVNQSFTITNPDSSILAPSFGYISNYPCAAPDISLHAPFLRPGFSNQRIYVQACNKATASGPLNSAYTIVELDPLFTVNSSSMPYTSLGNNQYQINLGYLYPGQCVDFWLSTTLATTAMLGQTLCMNAKLYPIAPCTLDSIPNPYPTPPVGSVSPCTLPWDRSSLRVEGSCVNDSIRFVVYNTGIVGVGDMDCYAPVRVYVDGIWFLLDSIQLQGGDSIVFMFAADGRTWRLEADQHPLHPGNSQPNATVERCGNLANWTSNLVNILPQDDADPIIDIYCGLVTGSYDPNDKTGYPLGLDTAHYIQPNQEMEYVIRFQNTGTDTAFTVVIRDTLSTDLDVFSVRSGASSHDYSFRIYGPRVLEWTFSNIMLPDSNVNEAGSHGFIVFKVHQKPNLPIGTVLENSASIYFDFNAPIFTNTSWHTIGVPQDLSWDGLQNINHTICDSYTFNNITYNHSGTYWQAVNNGGLDSLYTLNIEVLNSFSTLSETACASYTAPDSQVYTTSGQYIAVLPNAAGCDSIITINLNIEPLPSDSVTLVAKTLVCHATGYSYQWLDCDSGSSQIVGATNQSFTPTVDGNYAVRITNGTCTVVSNCFNVLDISTKYLTTDWGILIYPNPTTGILHLDKGNNTMIQIEVLDNLGQVLLVQESNDLITNIDMNGFPAGLYYVSVRNGERIVRTKVAKL